MDCRLGVQRFTVLHVLRVKGVVGGERLKEGGGWKVGNRHVFMQILLVAKASAVMAV